MTGHPPGLTVFLDRDGVLNVERDYLVRIEDFEFVPGAPEAVLALNRSGGRVFVVTNQSGVARGYYTLDDVERLHGHIQSRLATRFAHVDDFYCCPCHPEGSIPEYTRECDKRKPAAGMFHQAIRDHELVDDLRYVIGDSLRDLEAGKRVGCRQVLVLTGHGREAADEALAEKRPIDHVASSIGPAVDWILDDYRTWASRT